MRTASLKVKPFGPKIYGLFQDHEKQKLEIVMRLKNEKRENGGKLTIFCN